MDWLGAGRRKAVVRGSDQAGARVKPSEVKKVVVEGREVVGRLRKKVGRGEEEEEVVVDIWKVGGWVFRDGKAGTRFQL